MSTPLRTEGRETLRSQEPALIVNGIEVCYRNGAVGVIDVSMDMSDGEVVAVFGANGAGKTTVVRAITGFLRSEGAKITKGSVEVFGRRVTNAEPHVSVNRGIALVPERNKVYPNLTVYENLTALGTLPRKGERADAFARVFDLFPSIRGRQSEYAGRLSGGQQQMVAIARALLSRPRLLILDEMTLGLHFSMQEPLFAAVRSIVEGGTAVLMVDESTTFAEEIADRSYLLDSGRIVAEGAPHEFRGRGTSA